VTREERLERLASIARRNTISFERINPSCWPKNGRLLSYFALMIGALYALRWALLLGYEYHDSSSDLYVESCHQSLLALRDANEEIADGWAAGHYLNSAIHCMSSLCESISLNEFNDRNYLRDKFPLLADIYRRRNDLIHVNRPTISNADLIDTLWDGLENLSDTIAERAERISHPGAELAASTKRLKS